MAGVWLDSIFSPVRQVQFGTLADTYTNATSDFTTVLSQPITMGRFAQPGETTRLVAQASVAVAVSGGATGVQLALTVNGTTVTTSAQVVAAGAGTAGAEFRQFYRYSMNDTAETTLVTVNQAAASTAGGDLLDLWVFEIDFDAGWPLTAIPTINGTGRDGAALAETFTPSPGNVVQGSKVFASWDDVAVAGASVGANNCRVRLRNVLPTPDAPVTSFERIVYAGSSRTIATTDLTNGWIEVDGAVITSGDQALVLYTFTPSISGGAGGSSILPLSLDYSASLPLGTYTVSLTAKPIGSGTITINPAATNPGRATLELVEYAP